MLLKESRGEPKGERTKEVQPGSSASQEVHPALSTESKIEELEQHLAELRSLKEREATTRLTEMREREAQQHELEAYAHEAATAKPAGKLHKELPGAGSVKREITGRGLLEMQPDHAVEVLFELATTDRGGFEKAIRLLKGVAAEPGGAHLLDEFHDRLTEGGPATKEQG